MDLFAVDFYEERYKRNNYGPNKIFNDDDFSDLVSQANSVIENEKETEQRRAEACVRKFHLLETRYKLAPKLLERALALYPGMPHALTGMGCFYLHINDRENAIACFNKAIGSDPLFPYSWLQKAYIENDEEEKLRFLNEFIKLNPDSIIGYEERRNLLDGIADDMDSLFGHYKKPKLIKKSLQSAIDDYSELIRLVPATCWYYERRAELYIKMSKVEFMLSDDEDEFPSVNNNAVKDIEKLMSLAPEDELGNLITTVNNMLIDLPEETNIKYIEQMARDLSSDSNGYWIAQILYTTRCYSRDEYEKSIEIYTNIINSVKDGSFLQIYSYSNRSKAYLFMKEYEKALHDNEMRIKLCQLLPDKRCLKMEADPYWAMKDRIEILEKMINFKELINEYTKILETLKGDSKKQYFITDAYMGRAKIYKKNKDIEKALADYSAVIELGVTGIEYKVKDAYAARIAINTKRGEMDKVSADYKKMAELKEDSLDDFFCAVEVPKFEIIDLEAEGE